VSGLIICIQFNLARVKTDKSAALLLRAVLVTAVAREQVYI
jgi:hypothetical protein